jgi:flagellum-specific peptidoglycan hydrolase FlgJ
MSQRLSIKITDRQQFKLPLVPAMVVARIYFSWKPVSAQPERFISKYGPLADSLEREFGIPASLILGVSIIESSSGTSRNCRLLKNFFGVKGRNNLLKTKGIRSGYKQYATDTASFVDFCKIVSEKKSMPVLRETPIQKNG